MTIYTIHGSYQGQAPEELDTADNRVEAKRLLSEYRMAFGAGWAIWIKKA